MNEMLIMQDEKLDSIEVSIESTQYSLNNATQTLKQIEKNTSYSAMKTIGSVCIVPAGVIGRVVAAPIVLKVVCVSGIIVGLSAILK
jgi:hypothetical protein